MFKTTATEKCGGSLKSLQQSCKYRTVQTEPRATQTFPY